MKWTINFFKKTLAPQPERYQLSYPDLDRSPVAKTIKAFNRIILEIHYLKKINFSKCWLQT